MKFIDIKKSEAFTLIELLIVIGIIAILAAAVIIAINPGRQFAAARDATRDSHLNSINQAFLSYQIDNLGSFDGIEVDSSMPTEVCNTNVVDPINCGDLIDLSPLVDGGYISSLPIDPQLSDDSTTTGYEVAISEGEIILRAKNAETRSIATLPDGVLAVGGRISTFYDEETETEYKIHAFTDVGEHTFDFFGEDNTEIDVLVIAGGGGGGCASGGGGGGAGGLLYESNYNVSQAENIDIQVGAGGTSCSSGEESIFSNLTAIGGGHGGSGEDTANRDGADGGSGGGAGHSTSPPHYGGEGVSGQGYPGGDNPDGTNSPHRAAAGGGAGGPGDHADTDGRGGAGLYFGDVFGDQYGESGWFAGGGGGHEYTLTDEYGEGGIGGGGNGASKDGYPTDGMTGTGGGGGGSDSRVSPQDGSDGGSGIVLVRYSTED